MIKSLEFLDYSDADDDGKKKTYIREMKDDSNSWCVVCSTNHTREWKKLRNLNNERENTFRF